MPRSVEFNDKIVAKAKAVAPSFEFPLFAQTAVREKIDSYEKPTETTDGDE